MVKFIVRNAATAVSEVRLYDDWPVRYIFLAGG
jgi:hypothetical protein